MGNSPEENAYAEVFSYLFQNGGLRTAILGSAAPNPANDPPVVQGVVALSRALAGVLNIHGWWYLVYRTCQAEGATKVIEWLLQFGQGQAGTDAFMALDDEDAFRKDFTDWLQTQSKWWECGYTDIIVNGIGPWPKTGTGDD